MYIGQSRLRVELFFAFVIASLRGRERASKYVESVSSPLAHAAYHKNYTSGTKYASGDRNTVLSTCFFGLNTVQYITNGVSQSEL